VTAPSHHESLTSLLVDGVNDVVVTDDGRIWRDEAGALTLYGHIDRRVLHADLERILARSGRRLDRMTPIVDIRMDDGSRLCAVAPPVAVGGIHVALRRHGNTVPRLESFGSPATAHLLRTLVRRRATIVVTGATGAGKTTLVRALLAECGTGDDPTRRIVAVEDTAELVLGADAPAHLVRLETRPASPEGTPAIYAEDLVRTALRLRPDRIVVGEVRGDEVMALIQALNTGHRGCITTCHANSAADAIDRLTTLMIRAAPTWPTAVVRAQLGRALDIIVHLTRTGSRRAIDHIASVGPNGAVTNWDIEADPAHAAP